MLTYSSDFLSGLLKHVLSLQVLVETQGPKYRAKDALQMLQDLKLTQQVCSHHAVCALLSAAGCSGGDALQMLQYLDVTQQVCMQPAWY